MEESSHLLIQSPVNFAASFECKIRHIPFKRAFDIFFSAAALLLGLPLFVLIAISIRMTSKGKVLYSHERIGRGGKTFRCLKFRTMHKDADQRLKLLLENHPELLKEWELKRKLSKDPRITAIGAFLRRTSIDELPQFWNVLKGDLSVVGPRPVVKAEMEKFYGLKASKILSVRPGLTGIWQVSGRSDTCYSTRVMMDEKYVENQNMLLDIKLVLKTIPAMMTTKGAY